MRITVVSIPVRDQEKALRFYFEKLEFVKKLDIPLGDGNRWLTVVPEEEQDGPELLLEPLGFEPARTFQKALFEAGITYMQFEVDSVQDEFERLTQLGIEFSMKPTDMGTAKLVIFNDTCGNNIQIVEIV